MSRIDASSSSPELPEIYEALERIGRMAERGLNIARRYTDEVPLPVAPVVVPSPHASTLLHMNGKVDDRSVAESWADAREAVHWTLAPIIDAAFKVTTTWGYALWCVADNIPVEHLPEALAMAETSIAAAIVDLTNEAEACSYPPAVLRPGPDRIAALVGERGMEGARELMLDLLSYVAEQDSPAEVATQALATFTANELARWDDVVGEETGEMWFTPSDMDAAALLAAIKMQVLSRYDEDDLDDAWVDIVARANDSVAYSLRAFRVTDAAEIDAEGEGK